MSLTQISGIAYKLVSRKLHYDIFGFTQFLSMFFSTDLNGLVILENARPTYAYEVAVRICICIVRFQKEVNDKIWLNVLSTRYLEKGTIECRNVGVNNK